MSIDLYLYLRFYTNEWSLCRKEGRICDGYRCSECAYFTAHKECAESPPEIESPSHPKHPLKLLRSEDYFFKPCDCCREYTSEVAYHCSVCDFWADVYCARNPPTLSFLSLTTHEHILTLLPIKISFTCNACGMDGYWSPYACLQCYFVIHIQCIDLPRIININRHDHRISRMYCLDPEDPDPVCGVCRRPIDRRYGAYSCHSCPQYAVHSRCATLENVWDGNELYWKPEEVEDVEPFKVIAHNVIEHFSHKQHHLRFMEDGYGCEASIRCKACIRPINSSSLYSCMKCDFFLHERCANLPLKKRHMVFGQQLFLHANPAPYLWSWCYVCEQFSDGFKYITSDNGFTIDAQCSSIREPFDIECHHHPLYYTSSETGRCKACAKLKMYVLRCVEDGCEYALCFGCVGLPSTVKHDCDDHPLVLCYGEKQERGKYWCDICEEKTDPNLWFYICNHCGLTLHVGCVLGEDLAYFEPGSLIPRPLNSGGEEAYEVVANKGSQRPLCYNCSRRCMSSVALKKRDGTGRYLCSYKCYSVFG
ncbi:PREDICTED: uncharacterized protein LOC104820137 [Tarenaya hassleriana]|uniref:uncharacterized protein LOC104820137 n=1 Tax=Tarenaya hassleriana TaxID=28532 RepID=UPI00053C673E|nr:PREDICTED: uncharacterized protein LOC104820137 [Tarenaya hassleriana]